MFFHATKQAAKLGEKECILALAAPRYVAPVPALRKVGEFGRLFAIVEKLLHRDFKGACKLL
jgi:hypothetical protein